MLARARRAWAAAPPWVRTPVGVLRETIRLYYADHGSTHAAAIAYYAIFSLIPLSLVILSIAGLVVDQARIVRFVFDQIPLRESEVENVHAMVSRAHDVSLAGISFGAVLLLWSGSGVFGAVRRGLSAGESRGRRQTYFWGKVIDLTLIPAMGTLIVASVAVMAAAQGIIERAGEIGPLNLQTNLALQIVAYALPAAATFLTFTLLYRFVPPSRPGWMQAIYGALLAGALFELAKNLGALVFAQLAFEKETAIYAGFGTALAFLLWMFVSASILLLGSEFGRAVAAAREQRADAKTRARMGAPAPPAGAGVAHPDAR